MTLPIFTDTSMQIILWRHADAEDNAVSDLARALTPKGLKQAEKMAGWLKAQIGETLPGFRVIASPALRAVQTVEALGVKFDIDKTLAPDATVRAVLMAANWPNATENVIIIGHQPTLGMVAARLLNNVDGYVSVRKCAIWWFATRERGGEVQSVMKAMTEVESL